MRFEFLQLRLRALPINEAGEMSGTLPLPQGEDQGEGGSWLFSAISIQPIPNRVASSDGEIHAVFNANQNKTPPRYASGGSVTMPMF